MLSINSFSARALVDSCGRSSVMPRAFRSNNYSRHDGSLSQRPSWTATSSLRSSGSDAATESTRPLPSMVNVRLPTCGSYTPLPDPPGGGSKHPRPYWRSLALRQRRSERLEVPRAPRTGRRNLRGEPLGRQFRGIQRVDGVDVGCVRKRSASAPRSRRDINLRRAVMNDS